MKLRHSLAFALLGWYLLTLPYTSPGKFDSAAPLSRWSEAAEFSSIAECETYRQHHKPKDLARNGQAGHIDEAAEARLRLRGKCVSSDDSRLHSD